MKVEEFLVIMSTQAFFLSVFFRENKNFLLRKAQEGGLNKVEVVKKQVERIGQFVFKIRSHGTGKRVKKN